MPKKKTIAARRAPERRRAIQVLGIQAGLRFLAGAIDPAAQNRGFAIIGRAQVQHDGECERIFAGAGLSHRRDRRAAERTIVCAPGGPPQTRAHHRAMSARRFAVMLGVFAQKRVRKNRKAAKKIHNRLKTINYSHNARLYLSQELSSSRIAQSDSDRQWRRFVTASAREAILW